MPQIGKRNIHIELPRDGEEHKPLEKKIFLFQTLQTAYWVFALSNEMGRGTLIWYYTIMTPILLGIRYFQFKARDHHYFMFDFCYWVQILVLVALWGFPDQPYFFLMVYLIVHGPVPAAIPMYRNSLVFHSIDRFTSVYIHILPLLLFFNVRWFPKQAMAYMPNYENGFIVGELDWYKGICVTDSNSTTTSIYSACGTGDDWRSPLLIGGGGALGIYVAWQVLYAVIVFGVSRLCGGCLTVYYNEDKLTLYRYDLKHSTGWVRSLYDRLGEKRGFLLWASRGAILSSFGCFFAFVFYINFWADLAIVLLIFMSSIQNAGNFYIEAFAKVQQRARARALDRKNGEHAPLRDVRLSDRIFNDVGGIVIDESTTSLLPTVHSEGSGSDEELALDPEDPKSPATCNPLLLAAANSPSI